MIGDTKKPTRVWGTMYFRKLKLKTSHGTTCPNLIVRSTGRIGHRKILGATPQDGAPRVSLDDPYRIPEGFISYVMGWNRKPTDWIPKIPFQAPAGQPPPLPRVQPSSGYQGKNRMGKTIGTPRGLYLVSTKNCGYTPHPYNAACVKASV